jgi:hypothetical protein
MCVSLFSAVVSKPASLTKRLEQGPQRTRTRTEWQPVQSQCKPPEDEEMGELQATEL